ncbi:Uncharacterized membrane protein [Oscillospiraceae bacterium]|nr:Uncharacterized membrane protein [Oscillospiraceae bacterium]
MNTLANFNIRDAIDAAKSYIAAGNQRLRGKKMLVYFCLILTGIFSMIPSILFMCANPDVTRALPEIAKMAFDRNESSQQTYSLSSSQDTEYKSEGARLAEKVQARDKARKQTMIKYAESAANNVYYFLIGGILTIGMCSMLLRMDKREVGFKDLFNGFTSGNYINKVIALLLKSLIRNAIPFISTLMLLLPMLWIPALIVSLLSYVVYYCLFMVEFILADDPGIPFTRAIAISFKASSGYKLTLFIVDIITEKLPVAIVTFGYMFWALKAILVDDISITRLTITGIVTIIVFYVAKLILKPLHDAAYAMAYEDAKITGKSYGYISHFELYDPEDEIDNGEYDGIKVFG